jgi:formate hydrogenlyase transcriptional activator
MHEADLCIVYVDLEPRQRSAFDAEATRRSARLIDLDETPLADRPDVDPGLCILGLRDGVTGCAKRLRELRRAFPCAPVVVAAADPPGTEAVMELARLGAENVVTGDGAAAAGRAFAALRRVTSDDDENFVGASPLIRAVRRSVRTIAATDSTVLVMGETGTGKGVIARMVHGSSPRRDGPFVHVDCATLSPTIAESELFGHEKGAFTGALNRRPGRFELAEGGTIFLDEIGNLSLELQAKLLRILQDREYERIGGTRTLAMTARVVAATNRDLRQAVRDGAFRADLFYRLNVFQIRLPALRDRLGDIPCLAQTSVRRLCRRLGVPMPYLAPCFIDRLMTMPWSGNVRELLNVLERLVVTAPPHGLRAEALDGVVDDEPLALDPGTLGVMRDPLPQVVDGPERERIATTLVATGGNVARAARRLGMARSTLRYKIRVNNLTHAIPSD